jgi:hypothetical protein
VDNCPARALLNRLNPVVGVGAHRQPIHLDRAVADAGDLPAAADQFAEVARLLAVAAAVAGCCR